jgi:membrane protein implicated in regulation of membrane protease activity
MNFLKNMDWWHWVVFGVALAALETVIPGAVAIWFGIAAAVVGLVLLAQVPLGWELQWIAFALLGMAALIAYRRWDATHPDVDEQPNLNQRGVQYIGSEFVLVEPIEQGFGKAKVGDGVWKVSGPELPAGTRVKVTGVNGAVLVVAAA